MKSPVITLTTDFGLDDAYVAVMKGVILGINPQASIIDLCHTVQPFNVRQAAFLLGISHSYFPPGTIHLAVVDPGVGSQRQAILLATPAAFFVGPDNGLFSYVAGNASRPPDAAPSPAKLGPGCRVFNLNNPRYWRTTVSAIFHGRDIFAPVAAHLSLGVPPARLGESVPTLVTLPGLGPRRRKSTLVGQVVHVDRFGNLITDIREADLGDGRVEIAIGSQSIRGVSRYYAQGTGLLALIGSSGYLEIASRDGNASLMLGATVGEPVLVTRPKAGRGRRP